MRWAATLVLGMVACTSPGGVELRLDLPDDPALDPLAQVGELQLTVTAGAEVVHTATVADPVRGEALDFGEVPVGEGMEFEIRGVAASGRVVGFGRSGAPVDVRAGDVVEVPIRVRRAFVYLAGGDDLVAIDATREPGEAYATTIDVGGPVSGAVVTPDGSEVVVATDAALRRVVTATHAVDAAEVALPGPVVDLAVSPDGAWAAATHALPEAGVSIVDLAALRSGEPAAAVFVATPRAGAIAVGREVAWVLLEPINDLFCSGASSVAAIPLADPAAISAPVALGRAGSHLAVDPATDAALVSVACDGTVQRVAEAGATPEVVLEVPGLSAVTVDDGKLWAAGHIDGADAHLLLVSASLDGGAAETLDLPNTEERALAVDLEESGQGGELRINADLHSAFAIGVLPDREHVAVLDAAVYITEASGDAGGGQPIIPALQMVTYEYQLVQLDTGLGAQRMRFSCAIEWDPGALLDDFRCARAPGQDESPVPFSPTHLSALYGSP